MADRDAALFDAIGQTPNLRSSLVDTLAAQIEAGTLAPGQKLPTEGEIVQATGVSRTVVREALASLRARGLVTTRQGLGAFVAKEPPPPAFSLVPADMASIEAVLHVLELRMGVEVEAASLAASRRTEADLAAMRAQLAALDVATDGPSGGTQEDFGFHRLIAAATANPNFVKLFDTFGHVMVPRQWTPLESMARGERTRHFARMRREHGAILDAIERGDASGAQRAMRSHLSRAHARFQALRSEATD
ncbi:MAG: FadR family transcriptional regulator [Mesorhizobium amorphae]|nr:MAG: FadR family transcriptional regulator [Mesorhizobium amorphae]